MPRFFLYRRIVRLVKIATLLSLIFIIILLYLKLASTTLEDLSNNKPEEQSLKAQNYEITLTKPIFEGVNKNLEPYKIIAGQAIKTLDNKYNMQQIDAVYALNQDNLFIKASDGIMDDNKRLVDLTGKIEMLYGQAILNTTQMQIDLLQKQASNHEPVEILYKNSSTKADSFKSSAEGNHIDLQGNVWTRIKVTDF